MLVLTRKLGQNIVIGDGIVVKVLKISNNKVRLGIAAPHEVPVFRQEVIDKIKAFNQLASGTNHLELKTAANFLKNLIRY